MGAVRIYKDTYILHFPWAVRSDGCDRNHPENCNFGRDHSGFCNNYTDFEYVIDSLNDTYYGSIGAYLKK